MAHQNRLRFAVLMDITFSSFQVAFRNGIHQYARAAGIDVVFFGIGGMDLSIPEDAARASIFDLIVPTDFSGILSITTTLTNDASLEHLARRLSALKSLPHVSIGTSVTGEDSFVVDNRSGIRSIMNHLIGHHCYRSFAFVSGPSGNTESRARLAAFRESLADAGITQGCEWEYEGNFLFASGCAAVRELLDERSLKPDAFVCASDNMALGVCEALAERGLRVPFDVAVTGCDDMMLERTVSHGITTVHQSFSRLSALALERLHRLATGAPIDERAVVVPALRIRHSCGCLDFRARGLDAFPSVSGAPAAPAAHAARDAGETSDPDVAALRKLAEKALDDHGTQELDRAWIDAIREGVAAGRPIYEFEETLYSIRDGLARSGREREASALIGDLYAILCEECGQRAFISNKKDNIVTRRLRELTDLLHDGVSRDIALSGHEGVLDRIAELLGVRRFYLVRFGDFRSIGSAPSLVYAGGSEVASEGAGESAWKPAPDSLFPPNAGNLAVNLVHYEDMRFGYFIVDSDIPVPPVYEFMRFRFGFISMNLFNLDRIKRLNAELTDQIAIRSAAERRLKDALELVERLSIKDELTGLNNRRGFFMFADQGISYFRRQRSPFFVLYADMDGLKAINDRWGHTEGDAALRHAAASLQEALRGSDVVGRLGGDEFTMLVGTSGEDDFGSIRARIDDAFARKNREISKAWALSVSVGRYYSPEDDTLTLDEMLERADADLYREKGRKKGGAPV